MIKKYIHRTIFRMKIDKNNNTFEQYLVSDGDNVILETYINHKLDYAEMLKLPVHGIFKEEEK